MMNHRFQKTDKGREEIATRRYGLSLRLRSVLLLVDGKKSGKDLLHTYPGLGLTEALLADLEQQGFIAPVPEANKKSEQISSHASSTKAKDQIPAQLSMSIETSDAPAPKSDPVTLFLNTIFPDGELFIHGEPSEDSMLTAEKDCFKRPSVNKPAEEPFTLFEAIKACYLNGLRTLPPPAAAPLLRALNNAQTLKALAELRLSYVDALRAAKDKQTAVKLKNELDLLLFACEA